MLLRSLNCRKKAVWSSPFYVFKSLTLLWYARGMGNSSMSEFRHSGATSALSRMNTGFTTPGSNTTMGLPWPLVSQQGIAGDSDITPALYSVRPLSLACCLTMGKSLHLSQFLHL